jgi:hypothetical protein
MREKQIDPLSQSVNEFTESKQTRKDWKAFKQKVNTGTVNSKLNTGSINKSSFNRPARRTGRGR